jgi:hypothetical protein
MHFCQLDNVKEHQGQLSLSLANSSSPSDAPPPSASSGAGCVAVSTATADGPSIALSLSSTQVAQAQADGLSIALSLSSTQVAQAQSDGPSVALSLSSTQVAQVQAQVDLPAPISEQSSSDLQSATASSAVSPAAEIDHTFLQLDYSGWAARPKEGQFGSIYPQVHQLEQLSASSLTLLESPLLRDGLVDMRCLSEISIQNIDGCDQLQDHASLLALISDIYHNTQNSPGALLFEVTRAL